MLSIARGVMLVFLFTLLANAVFPWLDTPTLAMGYLLLVLFASMRLDYVGAITTAFISFLALNFFFIEPFYTFQVARPQALLELLGFLVVSLTMASMTEKLKKQAIAIRKAERENIQNALLASLSHDFRTPLTTIVGSASSLRHQREALSLEQQNALLILIELEALSMVDDAENILSLTRVETLGQLALSADWESPQELISVVVSRCRQRHMHRTFIAQVNHELPLIFVDAKLIIQALINLVENATKFDASDQPILLLGCVKDHQLWLSVRDHGIGLTQDTSALTAKFMRGKAESSHPGFGLGLSICDAVARIHNGKLQLENQTDGGVLATIIVPIQHFSTDENQDDQ